MRAIASTSVVLDKTVVPATIVFSPESGKIVHIEQGVVSDDLFLKRYKVTDFRDVSPMIIMPGLVDAHVHLNEPGRTEWEGFATGTQLAISGGVTTVIDMPLNLIPPTTTVENFELKIELLKGQTWCDVGFWGGLVPDNLDHLVPLIKCGVRGFKGFLIDSGVDEFPLINPLYIDQLMQRVQGNPTVLMFHLEMQPRVSLGPQVTFDLGDDSDNSGTATGLTTPLTGSETRTITSKVASCTGHGHSHDHDQDHDHDLVHTPSSASIVGTPTKDIDALDLGMSQSFISRAPPLIPELLRGSMHHREDHLHCRLPHNHAGSIDHSVLTDEQLIALLRSPVLSALEPRFGPNADLVNHHQELAPLDDSVLNEIDPTLYLSFLASRPDVFETTAIAEIIACSIKNPNVPLHVVHLATHELIPLIRAALEKGLPISVETCFHYLSLTLELIKNGSTQFKCCPPIRTQDNQDLLWQLLQERVIQTVVSDHSPCTPDLKSFNTGDFFQLWGGISSIGFGLSIMYTEVMRKKQQKQLECDLLDIIEWCCENTAKQVGLSHRKGHIREGYDADFLIFDPEMLFTIENDRTYFKNKMTAYHGRELKGRVVETIVGGNSVFALGLGVSDIPMGKLILERRIE